MSQCGQITGITGSMRAVGAEGNMSRRLGRRRQRGEAAENIGNVAEARERVGDLLRAEGPGGFVSRILGRELGL